MILLMLDFDGTLAPIGKSPKEVVLGPEARKVLQEILKNSQVRLSIISGRSLADIKKRVGLEGVYYAGCHGLEMEGPDFRYLHPGAKAARPGIRSIARDLRLRLSALPGIAIEDKGLTIAVHFRQAGVSAARLAKKTVEQLARGHCKKIGIMPGRKVLEIMPRVPGGKGLAVRRLLRLFDHRKPFPVYVGDDLTDEEAFRAIKGRGLSILVENRERSSETFADYRLSSIAHVREFLNIFIR